MAASTTQSIDFTLGFVEADLPWADWIIWVLESEGYTIEQKVDKQAYELDITKILGQHFLPIWSRQYLDNVDSQRQSEQILMNYDRGQRTVVQPIQIDNHDLFPDPDLITPLSLIDCDRILAQQKLLEAALSLPLPFNPPPLPPFRKPQPPFPGQMQGLILTKQRGQAQGYIEKLGDSLPLEMMQIPGGMFTMGAPESEEGSPDQERPTHQVTVQLFFMGRYPVTQAQWRFIAELPQVGRALDPNPSDFKGDKRPVEQVSSIDAIEFCERLSQFTGRSYRLPSEAEWEYACRAGTTTPFHFGETIDSRVANYAAQGNLMGSGQYGRGQLGEDRQQTIDVGNLNAPNAFGLHDMHGNVTQWCMDNWHITYEGAPNDGSAWLQINPENHHSRVRRGGSWKANARGCRSAFRSPAGVTFKSNHLGFRVVVSPASD
jgi:formylglycine-generating enzyme required for sulfatase activity